MPADPTTRRYFRIDSDGPTWWFVSLSAAYAWRQWADWWIDGGGGDDVIDEPVTMRELTEVDARAIKINDDGTKKTLADLEVGATICTEF